MEGISYCYMQACDKTLQKKEVFNQVLKKALNENAYPLPADTWNIETLMKLMSSQPLSVVLMSLLLKQISLRQI
ncbi:MAG: hypothetical protein LZT29_04187 [Pantoea stewartii]|nr:MAG: hypothetical protein LZT29_04187 [Pantoea stewartii]